MTARAVALDSLRALSNEELAAHLREQRGQLFQVRLQQTIGQVENHRQIRAIRKEIARTMTVQVEYRLAEERGEAPRAPRVLAKPSRRGRRAPAAEAAVAPSRSRRQRAAERAEEAERAETRESEDQPVAAAPDPVLDAVSDVEVERVHEEEAVVDAAEDGDAVADAPGDEAAREDTEQTATHTTGTAVAAADAGNADAGNKDKT